LIGVSHLGAFGNLYIELQALISSQRVRKGFSLWKSSTSREVIGADRPLEACNTMAGSIPCIIIDGSFYQGGDRKVDRQAKSLNVRSYGGGRLRYRLRKTHPGLRG
jgi:hypothetical protein